jgi:hypothetical protein
LHDHDGVISIPNDGEGVFRPLRKRGQKVAKCVFSVDDTLKQISNNFKEEW